MVIAVISLLVSILVPSLQRAKDLAQRVVCAASLRAVGLSLTCYGEDNDAKIPVNGLEYNQYLYNLHHYGFQIWYRCSLLHLANTGYIEPQTFFCAGSDYGDMDSSWPGPPPGWSERYWGNHIYVGSSGMVLVNYLPAAGTVVESSNGLMSDPGTLLVADYSHGPDYAFEIYRWNHADEGGNRLYNDAHVEWVDASNRNGGHVSGRSLDGLDVHRTSRSYVF